MKSRIILFLAILFLYSSAIAIAEDSKTASPDNVRNSSDFHYNIPSDMQVTKVGGNVVQMESTADYTARKIGEQNKKIDEQKRVIDELKSNLRSLDERLSALEKKMQEPAGQK